MSSGFKKALGSASDERKKAEQEKRREEAERARNIKQAHSIIGPYLARLGPEVVRAYRKHKVPTVQSLAGAYSGRKGFQDLGYWKFRTDYDPEDSVGIAIYLYKSGKFGWPPPGKLGFLTSRLYPVVGMIQGGEMRQLTYDEGAQWNTCLYANFDDRRVYVAFPEELVELGEYLARRVAVVP